MSLATRELQEWKIYAGIPAKPIKNRSKKLLNYAKKLYDDQS